MNSKNDLTDKFFTALKTEWESISNLGNELTESDWELDTACTNWSVKDNLSHIIGTELFLLGQGPPEIELPETSHIKNDIGQMNELYIQARRDKSGAEVLAEFDEVAQRRIKALDELTPEQWEAEGPSPVGVVPYYRFMRVRLLDCWIHEQDIRQATQKPGNQDAEVLGIVLDEIAAALGFVVGKKAGAPDGCKVQFDLTGTAARTINIEVAEGRAKNVDSLEDADITIQVDSYLFTRLTAGRIKDPNEIKAMVDVETNPTHAMTAKSIVENINYML